LVDLPKPLFFPHIRAVVITGLLPKPLAVMRHKFQRAQPLGAFPKIGRVQFAAGDESHHTAQGITVVGGDRFAVQVRGEQDAL